MGVKFRLKSKAGLLSEKTSTRTHVHLTLTNTLGPRRGGGEGEGLQILPETDQVVQTAQIAVLVVTLHPLRGVSDCDALGKGCGLSKVDHVDGRQTRAVVHK